MERKSHYGKLTKLLLHLRTAKIEIVKRIHHSAVPFTATSHVIPMLL